MTAIVHVVWDNTRIPSTFRHVPGIFWKVSVAAVQLVTHVISCTSIAMVSQVGRLERAKAATMKIHQNAKVVVTILVQSLMVPSKF